MNITQKIYAHLFLEISNMQNYNLIDSMFDREQKFAKFTMDSTQAADSLLK